MIGHRGASGRALENCLDAFLAARDDGADGIELDARLCQSGEVVVFHDDDLRRLAGRPERIAELPLDRLREVRLRGAAGEGRIPTLVEVLEATAPLLVNVELKVARHESGARLARAVATLVERLAPRGRLLVSSFHPVPLLLLRRLAPALPRALLFGDDQSLPLRRAWARYLVAPSALHPAMPLVDEARLARWHREGFPVNVWTVDALDDARRLAALGVDGLITDRPAAIRALFER